MDAAFSNAQTPVSYCCKALVMHLLQLSDHVKQHLNSHLEVFLTACGYPLAGTPTYVSSITCKPGSGLHLLLRMPA